MLMIAKKRQKEIYRMGGKIAAQLTPVNGLAATAAAFGLSKNRVLQIEREALWKIATRLREKLEFPEC